jgi:hypothetical protein
MRLLLMMLLGCALPVQAAHRLSLSWTNNLLTLTGPEVPGGSLQLWYLEAFCRGGSTHRRWEETTLPHRTEWVKGNSQSIELLTRVEPGVRIRHRITVRKDGVDFDLEMVNEGREPSPIQWFQPCLRVGAFTGKDQETYPGSCFIFTAQGPVRLDQLPRTEEALYRGGQVYVPRGIPTNDVNPRPISTVRPVNGLIGAVSADQKKLVAMAWSRTQELFQGVIVCIHSDPRVGGLAPGERKKLRGKLYLMDNDPKALLRRHRRDFPGSF